MLILEVVKLIEEVHCHFLGNSLVAWSSRKQSSVAQSSAKSEYVVVVHKLFG